MTNIIVQLPEDIAQRLESRWKDLPRAALESLALEAYRSELLIGCDALLNQVNALIKCVHIRLLSGAAIAR